MSSQEVYAETDAYKCAYRSRRYCQPSQNCNDMLRRSSLRIAAELMPPKYSESQSRYGDRNAKNRILQAIDRDSKCSDAQEN